MSILTKIFIVITLVLVLLACPVFITQATIAPSYKFAWEKESQRSAAIRQEAIQAAHAADRANQDLVQARRAAASAEKNHLNQIAGLQSELASAKQDNAKIQGDLADIRFGVRELEANYKLVEARRVALEADRTKLLEAITKLQQETRELQASLKDEMARADRLEKVARVLREEIASKDERIAELSDKLEQLKRLGGAAQPGIATAVEPKTAAELGERFQADVLAINNDVASINAGSRKGVKTGMKLIIFRQDKFVAYLRISEVDINEAVGVVTDRKLDPVQGDKVMGQQ